MSLALAEIQKGVNTLLQNDWVKVLGLPILDGLYMFFKYLLERKIEGKPDTEQIAQLASPDYVGWWCHGNEMSVVSPTEGKYTRRALGITFDPS